jgi:hypothetical protein
MRGWRSRGSVWFRTPGREGGIYSGGANAGVVDSIRWGLRAPRRGGHLGWFPAPGVSLFTRWLPFLLIRCHAARPISGVAPHLSGSCWRTGCVSPRGAAEIASVVRPPRPHHPPAEETPAAAGDAASGRPHPLPQAVCRTIASGLRRSLLHRTAGSGPCFRQPLQCAWRHRRRHSTSPALSTSPTSHPIPCSRR